jgi:predicted O-methyltransferase YrrM
VWNANRKKFLESVRPFLPPVCFDVYRRLWKGHSSWAGDHSQEVEFELPVRGLFDLFPGIEFTPIQVMPQQVIESDLWALPLRELLIISAITIHLNPRFVFEFGTFTGRTTLAIAMNSASDTKILTLDIDPSMRSSHEHGLGSGMREFPLGEAFYHTDYETKIKQLTGESRTFDYTPYYGTMDFVFIDADHTYEFVRKDSANAMKLLSTQGCIIWDDYLFNPEHPECAGVARYLREILPSGRVFSIEGTRLAILVGGPVEAFL